MTKTEFESDAHLRDQETKSPSWRMIYSGLLALAALVAVVFGAGVVTGFADSGGEDHLGVLLAIVAVWGAVVFCLTWLSVRTWPRQVKEPVSRSTKRARSLIYGATAIGFLGGILFGFNKTDLLSNGPMAVYPSLIAIAVWLIIMPVVTGLWWRTTDEHDRASYADGANVAAHAYLFIAPSWWIATRAGLLPAQNPMIVLLLVSVIWSAVWFKRKYF